MAHLYKKISQKTILAAFSILVIISIFLPFLQKGYIFELDHVWTVKKGFTTLYYNGWLWFRILRDIITYIFPSFLIEKTWIILIGFLCLYGGYKLMENSKSVIAKIFSGIFYFINPFTYDHFLVGQTGILFSYALLPFFIIELFKTEKVEIKQIIKLSLLGFLIVSISHHFVFIILPFILFYFFYKRDKRKYSSSLKEKSKVLLILALLSFLLNLNWFVPNFFGISHEGNQIQNEFNFKDFKAFRTQGDKTTGIWGSVAGLQGFWVENQGKFVPVRDIHSSTWIYYFTPLLLLSLFGAVSNIKNKQRRFFIITFITSSIIAYFLAIGVSTPTTKSITLFLYEHLPFYKGMREPHKWVTILCLSYAYLGGIGIDYLIGRFKKMGITIGIMSIALVFAYVPYFMWSFHNQVKINDYPQEWYDAKEFFNNDTDNYQVLVFPWHQYMRYSFTNKIHVNPANVFFDIPIIQGDNIEFLPYIYSQSNRPESKYVETFVGQKANRSDIESFGSAMKELNIKYIVLLKEVDFGGYRFLDKQSDLESIDNNKHLILYKNNSWNQEDIKTYEEKYPQRTTPLWFFILLLPIQFILIIGSVSYLFYSSYKNNEQ